jgi:hypothetical protein
MKEHPRIESQRRYIERRADELLERIPFMGDAELRWTVRVFRDCLSTAAQEEMLRDYSEYLELHQMRQVVKSFIPRYTDHALEELEAKRFTTATSLRDMTDEELQAMSAAEKWRLLADDPNSLDPHQVRRELARLFVCHNFDLFHDPGLGEAAVEFNLYLDLLEQLRRVHEKEIEGLKHRAVTALRGLDHRDVSAVEAALTTLREAIGRSVGFIPPFDHLLSERLERWPRTAPTELRAVVNPEIRAAVEGMNLEQLRTSLRVLVELMNLEEQGRELAPLQAAYRSLDEIPREALTSLLPHLSMRLGDRNICDFALRYRSGRLWARERVNPDAWKLLPLQDKFGVLEADNDAMDHLQVARHLARLLLTERYELLFDPAYQVGLTHEPIYRRILAHCMREVSDPAQLKRLNRQVTRMMLELEEIPPDGDKPARLRDIREAIRSGLQSGSISEER